MNQQFRIARKALEGKGRRDQVATFTDSATLTGSEDLILDAQGRLLNKKKPVVTEAPQDGKVYGRRNAGWQEVKGGKVIVGGGGSDGSGGDGEGGVGPAGPPGPAGPMGPTGPTGPQGPAGGDSTVPGPIGPQGATGLPGANSTVPGPTGPTGPTGATGPQGPAGADGAGSPGTAPPIMDGTATVGTSLLFSRQDHVHPTDTSRAAVSHTHTAANVTDFSEAVDDRVGSLLTAGTNVTLNYNDAANTLTINSSASAVTPAALTKTDDTNVTLTLGGTPATALLQASSIAAGWAGTLSAARGGFGTNIAASSGVPLFATGVPTFTATTGTGNFVRADSPALTGNPTAPTPAVADNDTSIATTAFVTAAIAAGGGGGGSSVLVSDTPPVGAADNTLWWESDSGLLWIKYNDGTSTQWVIACPQPDVSAYVRHDVAQSLTTTQQTQARSNIYAAPFNAMAYSGMQINGGMEVSQELGGSGTFTNGAYILDGWKLVFGGTMGVYGVQGATTTAYPGFTNSLAITCQTAQGTLGASDYCAVYQPIEGYRIFRLQWGLASAQPITLSFWSNHHRTGLYSGSVRNGVADRTYVFTYTHNVSDVPQYNSITIPGDTAGVWASDNSRGINLLFSNGAGSGLTAPSINAWLAGGYHAASGQVNGVAATSDVFRITGVTVLPGTQAPTAAQSPNVMRPYGEELVTCQRYFYSKVTGIAGYAPASGYAVNWYDHPVIMRAAPTTQAFGGSGLMNTVGPIVTDSASISSVRAYTQAQGTGSTQIDSFTLQGDARL